MNPCGLLHGLFRQSSSGDIFAGSSRFIMQRSPVQPPVLTFLAMEMDGFMEIYHGPQTGLDQLYQKCGRVQPSIRKQCGIILIPWVAAPHQLFVSSSPIYLLFLTFQKLYPESRLHLGDDFKVQVLPNNRSRWPKCWMDQCQAAHAVSRGLGITTF